MNRLRLLFPMIVAPLFMLAVDDAAASDMLEVSMSAGLSAGKFSVLDGSAYRVLEANGVDLGGVVGASMAWSLDIGLRRPSGASVGCLLHFGHVEIHGARFTGEEFWTRVFGTNGHHWYFAPRLRSTRQLGRAELFGEVGAGMRYWNLASQSVIYVRTPPGGPEDSSRVSTGPSSGRAVAGHLRLGVAVGQPGWPKITASGMVSGTVGDDYLPIRWSAELGLRFALPISQTP